MSSKRKNRRIKSNNAKNASKRKPGKRKSKDLNYDGLEPRHLLATLWSFDSGSGALTVNLQNTNDAATIDVSSGNVTVNGNADMNTGLAGMQNASVASLQSIQISGTSNSGQQVTLAGDYSTSAGGMLNTVSIASVSGVTISGSYELTNGFDVTTTSAESALDASTGSLVVGGATDITYNEGIDFSGASNDFVGTVAIADAANVTIQDISAIEFGTVEITGDLSLSTSGNISQASLSDMVIQGEVTIDAGAFDVTLDKLTNDFQDNFNVVGKDVTIEDTTDLAFGVATVSGDFSARSRGDMTDDGAAAINVTGASAISTFLGEIVLDNGTHNFGTSINVTSAASGAVSLNSNSDIVLAPNSFPDDLTLVSGGNISVLGAGIVTVQGSSSLTAVGNIEFSNPANNFGSSVTASGVDLAFSDTNELVLGTITASGDLATSASTSIFQAGGPVTASGTSTIHATDGVFFDNPSNNFAGTVNLTGGNILIRDTNDLTVGTTNITGNLNLTVNGSLSGGETVVAQSTVLSARGPVTFTTSTNDFQGHVDINNQITGGAVSIVDVNDLTFRQLNVNGSITADSGGTLDQTFFDSLVVSGTSTLTAVNDISFTVGNNDFGGNVSAAAVNIELVDTNDLNVSTLNATGTLRLEADNAIGGSQAINVGGTTEIVSGGNIAFSHSNNDFGGAISLDTQAATGTANVTLVDQNSIILSNVDATDDLNLTAGTTITQSPSTSVEVQGTATLTATNDIVLGNETNDFVGPVNVATPSATQSVTLADSNDLELGTGNFGADLDLTVGGAISRTSGGAISVTGNTTIDAGGNVTLNNSASDFVGNVSVQGANIDLADVNSLSLTAVSATGNLVATSGNNLSATGIVNVAGTTDLDGNDSISLNNAGNDLQDTVTADSTGSIQIKDLGGLTLGNVSSGTTLDLESTGAISQFPGSSIVAGGSSAINAGDDLTIANSANDFQATLNAMGTGDVSIRDANNLTIATNTYPGDLTITTGGSLSQSGRVTVNGETSLTTNGVINFNNTSNHFVGEINIDSSSGLARISSNQNIVLGQVNVSNNLAVSAIGTLTTISDGSGTVNVSGITSLFSDGGDIALDNLANDFVGRVDMFPNSLGTVTISDANELVIGSDQVNNLHLTAGANIRVDGNGSLNVPGTTIIKAGGDIDLSNAANDFVGLVEIETTLATANVQIADANTINFGDANMAGDLTISAGNVEMENTKSMTVAGETTVTATGSIELDGVGNDFVGPINTTSGSNTILVDSNSILIGNVSTGTEFFVSAMGGISQEAGSGVVVDGPAGLISTGNVTLDQAGNDFKDAVTVDTHGSVSLTDQNSLQLGTADFEDDLTLVASGTIDIGGSAPVSVAGKTSISNSGGDIVLSNPANDFVGEVSVTAATIAGQNVTLADSNDLLMGSAIVSGDLTLTTNGSITQTASSTFDVDGNTSLTATTGEINLGNETNDFTGFVTSLASTDVTLADASDLILGTAAFNNDLTITTGGDLTRLASGAMTVQGATNLTVSGDLTLDNFANDFIGPVSLITDNASSIVSLIDSNDLEFGTVNAAGDISVSSLGAMTQTSAGSIVVQGESNFDASGDITLNRAINDFVGPVNASLTGTSQNVVLADANAIELGEGNYSGDLTISAGGNISREGNLPITVQGTTNLNTTGDITLDAATNNFVGEVNVANAENATLRDAGNLNFGSVNVNSNLVATSVGGGINDGNSGQIIVGGLTTLASANSIVLNNSGNDFGGAVNATISSGTLSIADANDLSLNVPTALVLGQTTVGDQLTITATDDLTQVAGGLMITGPTVINTSANIDFETAFNDFGGTVSINATNPSGSVALSDSNDLTLGTSVLAGDFSAVADNLASDVGATIMVAGDTNLGGLGNIALVNANDFGGTVTVQALGSVNLRDINALALGAVDVDQLTLMAGSLTSDISKAVIVDNQANIAVVDNASLNSPTNEFRGTLAMSSTAVGQVTVNNLGALELGTVNTHDAFKATASGAITQAINTSIVANGISEFIAGGSLILDGANNDFSTIKTSVTGANDVHITDSNELVIGTQSFGGDLAILSGGSVSRELNGPLQVSGDLNIQMSGGSLNLNSATNSFDGNVTITNSDDSASNILASNSSLILDEIDIAGDLQLTSNGSITEAVGGKVTVDGMASLSTLSGGDIVIDNTGTDFADGLRLSTTGDATIHDTNELQLGNSLGAVNVNNLTVTTLGDLTDANNAIVVNGAADLSVGGDLVLDNAANDFVGAVAITQTGGGSQIVKIRDANSLTFSSTNLSGNLDVAANSFDMQSNSAITVAGNSLFNVQQNLSLTNPANDFVGPVSIVANNVAAQDVSLADANDLQLDEVNVSGNLNINTGGDITDDSGPVQVTGTSTLNSGADIVLDNLANDFTGTVSATTTGGDVTLADANAIQLGGSGTYSGDLTVTAPGQITNGGSPIAVLGATSLTTESQVIFDNANNDFQGPVSVDTTAGANADVTLRDANAIELGNVLTSGSLMVTAGDAISQAVSTKVAVTGATSLSAGDNIVLDSVSNDFVGSVLVTSSSASQNVTLVDANDLNLGAGTFASNLTASAGGNLVLGQVTVVGTTTLDAVGNVTATNASNDFAGPINSTASNLTLVDTNAVSLNQIDIANKLDIDAGGAITQTPTGAVTVGGESDLESGIQIFLNGPNNDFVGSVNVLSSSATHPVFLSDTNDLLLGAGSFGADLGIFTGGDVATSGPITTSGHLSIFAGGNVNLNNAANSLGGLIGISGADVTIVDSTATQLDEIVATGNLDVDSTVILGTEKVTVDGTTTLAATGDITLTDSLNRFNDLLNVSATNATLVADDLQLDAVTITGNLDIDSSGQVTQSTTNALVVGGNLNVTADENVTLTNTSNNLSGTITAAAKNISFANSQAIQIASLTAMNDLTLNADGAVTQSGQVFAGGQTSILADGIVSLTNLTNDFENSVSIDNQAVTADVSLVDVNDLQLGLVNTQGNLNLTAGGELTQNNLSSVNVSGQTSLNAISNITLNNAINDFEGAVTVTSSSASQDVDLADANDLTVSGGTFAADLKLQAGSNLQMGPTSVVGQSELIAGGTVNANNSSNDFAGAVAASANNIFLRDINDIQLGEVTANTSLNVVSGGAITQTTSPVSVSGETTLNAVDDITLAQSSNDFVGPLNVTSSSPTQSITLGDANGLVLGTGTFGEDLTVNIDGPLTMENGIALSVTGDTAIDVSGDVTLNNPANSFGGTISLNAADATIVDSSDLAFANVDLTGDLQATSTGAISQTAGSSLEVDGSSTFTSMGDLTLDNAANQLSGPIQVTSSSASQDVSIVNDTNTILGANSFGADLNIVSSGSVTQSAGDAVSVAGTTSITSGTNTDLSNSGNDFVGNVTATGTDISLQDTNSISLGTIDASGTFELVAAGAVTGGPVQVEGTTNISSASDITLDHSANDLNGPVSIDTSLGTDVDVSLTNTGDTLLTDVNINGNLDVNTVGAFTTNGPVEVTGETTLQSSGDITLNNAGNDFGGAVNLLFNGTDQDVSLADANDIVLGTAAYPANLNVSTGGDISLNSALTVVGDTTIQAGGNAVFDQVNTDFGGAVNIAADDISIRDANELDIANLDADGNLTIITGGDINGPSAGPVSVQGTTSITSDGRVILRNTNNDFVGAVDVNLSSGVNQRLALTDANDLLLNNIDITGKLTAIAGGNLRDTNNADISVAADAELQGNTITIGESTSDSFQANRVKITSAGSAEVHEDGNSTLVGVDAASLEFESTGRLLDANQGSFNVAGDAKLKAQLAINLGDRPTDSFNAGRLNFEGSGTVLIQEDSSMELFGESTGGVVFLTANGAITDADSASLNARARTNFKATSVVIGDTATDEFNASSLSLEVTGDASVKENSLMLLTGNSTVGGDMNLESTNAILDSFTANFDVSGNAGFVANSVWLGDRNTDRFNSGSVSFDTVSTFQLTENSATVLAGTSSAVGSSIVSEGEITNDSTLNLNITATANFTAPNMTLGNQAGDFVSVGSTTLNVPGNATAEFDETIVFTGSSTVGSLNVTSTGSIVDSSTASLTVAGASFFNSSFVKLGDTLTDTFNSGRLSFESDGNVVITENSTSILTGVNSARNVNLISSGNILDDATAETTIINTARFTGVDLIIGELADDCFDILNGAGGLTTNGTGTVNVQLGC